MQVSINWNEKKAVGRTENIKTNNLRNALQSRKG